MLRFDYAKWLTLTDYFYANFGPGLSVGWVIQCRCTSQVMCFNFTLKIWMPLTQIVHQVPRTKGKAIRLIGVADLFRHWSKAYPCHTIEAGIADWSHDAAANAGAGRSRLSRPDNSGLCIQSLFIYSAQVQSRNQDLTTRGAKVSGGTRYLLPTTKKSVEVA